jgi:hypothetical protein
VSSRVPPLPYRATLMSSTQVRIPYIQYKVTIQYNRDATALSSSDLHFPASRKPSHEQVPSTSATTLTINLRSQRCLPFCGLCFYASCIENRGRSVLQALNPTKVPGPSLPRRPFPSQITAATALLATTVPSQLKGRSEANLEGTTLAPACLRCPVTLRVLLLQRISTAKNPRVLSSNYFESP